MLRLLVNLPMNELNESVDELCRCGRELYNVQNTQKFTVFTLRNRQQAIGNRHTP